MKKRVIISSVLAVTFFISIVLRLGYIIFSGAYPASDLHNSYSIIIDTIEPNLYYSNNRKLTNNVIEKYALLKPNAKTLKLLPQLFSDNNEIIEELKYGKPILKKTSVTIPDIKYFNVTSTKNNCSQLVSKECSGLLKYLPDKVGEKRLSFHVDALGHMLSGENGEVIDDNYISAEGLQLTLDEEIQNSVYNACKDMKSGCAVVMRISDSALLACVSKPDDSYINKPFALYSVGSVFKLLITASALENSVNTIYDCNGKITVGDTTYNCQKNKKHGKQNLENALANSCNCYFVKLALILGYERILKTAESFHFGENIKIYDDFTAKGSVLPDKSLLEGAGELPLLGFGQGSLMSSPLQIGSMLCTIANAGNYNHVKLVDFNVDKFGKRTKLIHPKTEKVISNRNSYLLMKYMRSVVENGTGSAADYQNNSAGKTATAQTGQYNDGNELLNTWFAGIYPYNKPEYAIVIMNENGKSGAEDCCPIFRTIVENLE